MSADRRTRQKRDRAKTRKSLLPWLVPAAVFAALYYYAFGDESIGRYIRNFVHPIVEPIMRFMDGLFAF